jgi:23S rRNA (cytidine1920-2'-O)/16S rRNA (cytidine1409-2'-O)-methyltransferase
MICLIKPQFECGKDIATKYKGIILNKEVHIEIINNMINYFNKNGFYVKGIDYSPIKGGDGNIEYITYITNKNKNNIKIDVKRLVKEAFK